MRRSGRALHGIAEMLNVDGVSTAHGGRRLWPSTVRAVLERERIKVWRPGLGAGGAMASSGRHQGPVSMKVSTRSTACCISMAA